MPVGEHLRLLDPETGKLLPTRAEAREAEARARQAAEAEVERLRGELAARNRPNGRNGR